MLHELNHSELLLTLSNNIFTFNNLLQLYTGWCDQSADTFLGRHQAHV